MTDFRIPLTGGTKISSAVKGDRFLAFEGYGVKKLEVATATALVLNGVYVDAPGRILEFPAIGASLPCVFTVNYIVNETSGSLRAVEYDNQPGPDYFNITGVDDFGNPLYAESEGVEEKA